MVVLTHSSVFRGNRAVFRSPNPSRRKAGICGQEITKRDKLVIEKGHHVTQRYLDAQNTRSPSSSKAFLLM